MDILGTIFLWCFLCLVSAIGWSWLHQRWIDAETIRSAEGIAAAGLHALIALGFYLAVQRGRLEALRQKCSISSFGSLTKRSSAERRGLPGAAATDLPSGSLGAG
ncbi:hypothetical protein AAW51_2303 [Caldimonas brevitalea]|uniref:Uncharacterized protein n=2 Tax=Caldimonas brevitalea TaxID=413882 RepID=A0A0G3BHS8_9BURK|nr:hypothetical protein AAW51_2303 [Caldimonas brevitalea]